MPRTASESPREFHGVYHPEGPNQPQKSRRQRKTAQRHSVSCRRIQTIEKIRQHKKFDFFNRNGQSYEEMVNQQTI